MILEKPVDKNDAYRMLSKSVSTSYILSELTLQAGNGQDRVYRFCLLGFSLPD